MKKIVMLAVCFIAAIIIAACQASTPVPVPTLTPTPTNTPAPTATTIPPTPTLELSDVVKQTYDGIELIYRQEFGNDLPSFSPVGWIADGEKLYTTSDSALEINGRNSVALYEDETISVNKAIIIRFKFAPQSSFTIGIDGLRQGERIPAFQPGFRSVTTDFRNSTPLVFFNSEQNHYYTRFDGDLKPLPDIWYMYTLGFAPGKQFIIKIWDPENPKKVLTYRKQVDDMTNVNVFIMWVNQNDTVYIDDFTVIKFSGLK